VSAPACPPRRVLIIKPSSLGDVVSAVPVLRGLRRQFPGAHLSWLVTPACADILRGQADLDEVILFDRRRYGRILRSPSAAAALAGLCRRLRRRRFDWAIDLQGLFRSGFLAFVSGAPLRAGFADAREMAWVFYTHRVRPQRLHTVDRNLAVARALGVDAGAEDLALDVPEQDRRSVGALLQRRGLRAGTFVVAVPGTRRANKMYPPRLWRRVLAALRPHAPVVVVGAPNEQALCEAVTEGAGEGVFNLAGRTRLGELVALIAAAGAVICCDSAANFIAPAVGTPLVTLMGPTRPERTGPYRGGRALTADVPCLGCLKRRCRHVVCMQWIDPERVVQAVLEMMWTSPRTPQPEVGPSPAPSGHATMGPGPRGREDPQP